MSDQSRNCTGQHQKCSENVGRLTVISCSDMRSFSALGKPSDSYGSLLTSVILGKLSTEIKAGMAQDHYDVEWTIDTLMGSILKEIQIFETGQYSGRKATSLSTTNSFYLATNRGTTRAKASVMFLMAFFTFES